MTTDATYRSPCGRVVLYRGDNLAVLPLLGAGSIDAVITDPPYGFHGEDDEGRRRNIGVYRGNGPNPEWHELDCADWNDSIPLDWICQLEKFMAPGAAVVAWTDSLRPHVLQEQLEAHGLKFLRLLFWEKTNPPSNPSKNFMNSVEMAVFARMPGLVRAWRGGGCSRNILKCAKVDGNGRFHPTQKPLKVMEWSMAIMSDTGHTILDPFMGSGTTGVAALRMGRRFVGIERDEKHYQSALRRLAAELSQGRLWNLEEATE